MAANDKYPYAPGAAQAPPGTSPPSAALPPQLPHPHPAWLGMPPQIHPPVGLPTYYVATKPDASAYGAQYYAHPAHSQHAHAAGYAHARAAADAAAQGGDSVEGEGEAAGETAQYRPGYYAAPAGHQAAVERVAVLEAELAAARREIDALRGKLADVEKERAKADTTKAQSRYWTPDEHQRFLEALRKHGPKDVRAIANHVGSRNATQVRTHAQKYFLRVAREQMAGPASALQSSRKRSMSESDLVRMGKAAGTPPGSPVQRGSAVQASGPRLNPATAAAVASARAPLSGAGGSMSDMRNLTITSNGQAYSAFSEGTGKEGVGTSSFLSAGKPPAVSGPPAGVGAVRASAAAAAASVVGKAKSDAMQLDTPGPPSSLPPSISSPLAMSCTGSAPASPVRRARGVALGAPIPHVASPNHQPRISHVASGDTPPRPKASDATGMNLLSMVAREAAEQEASSSQKRQINMMRQRTEQRQEDN